MKLDPEVVWSSAQLPTLPTVAVRLLELVRNPETEVRDVIETIKSDPAISAKILKAANSTYFGFRTEVKAIDRAIPLLGTTVATSLALSFSLTDDATDRKAMAEHYRQFWLQSLVQATASELIGRKIEPAVASEYFLSGLLLDLGRLAMLKTIPQEYKPVLVEAAESKTPLLVLEQSHLGFDHVEIGQRLMQNWKLPEAVVHASAFHHASLEKVLELGNRAEYRLLVSMAFAAAVGDYFCTPNKGLALHCVREIGNHCLGIVEDDIVEFLQKVEERSHLAAGLFNINASTLGNSADLMIQANEQLVHLALREHVASTQASIRQHVAEQEKRQLEDRNRELQQQALHDPLTQVYNRKFFDETVRREVHNAVRLANPLGVLFLDVDHFKKINDTYGHQFGDVVLRRLAKIFQETIRNADVLARYGGEEFVILVNQPTDKGLERLAERLRERVAAEQFQLETTPVQVTVSLGGAIGIPRRGENTAGDRLIAIADECLYQAKREGRNRFVMRSVIEERDRQLNALVVQARFSRWLVQRRVLEIPAVSRILLDFQQAPTLCGEIAVRQGYLEVADIHTILHHQELTGDRFCTAAVRLGLMNPKEVVYILATQQEDPHHMAACLIRAGILAPDLAAASVEEYLKTIAPPARKQALSAVGV